jgi:fatty-acyl-CoA synthase
MLTLANRSEFQTLLDAIALNGGEAERDAIIYLETDHAPIHISRREFRANVLAHAAALNRLGIDGRELAVIAHTQNLESIFAFWGALVAGAIPSMFPTLTKKLDPDIYLRSMAELARLSHVRAILTTDDFAPQMRDAVPCPVYASQHLAESVSKVDLAGFENPPGLDPDEIAFLQHSSGTTGLQKGVALSHRAVLNQIASYSDALALNDRDVIVSWLPLYHDMGLIAGFLLPLLQGVPLVLMSPFDWVQHPALLFRAIHDYRGTLCWLPNFAYNHSARRIRQRDTAGLSLASMRLFINCSEPVRADSHQQFLDRFAANGVTREMLAVSYAMAENTFAVTQTPIGQAARLDVVDQIELEYHRVAKPIAPDQPHAQIRVSCGPCIPGTSATVIDDQGCALPERHVGQIAVQSDCMLSGYYQRPDLQPVVDGWFHTGDMGYIADGAIYIVGRSKDLIINAGKNVYPQDIEAMVNTVPGVHAGRAVAFGVFDDREGTELIGVVAEVDAASAGAVDPIEHKRIAQAIRQAAVKHSQITITYVHLVDDRWLIKTSSGKIARAANRDKWRAETLPIADC